MHLKKWARWLWLPLVLLYGMLLYVVLEAASRGLYAISSTLALYTTAGLLSLGLLEMLRRLLPRFRDSLGNLRLSLLVMGILLLGLEMGLRFFGGAYRTYTEQTGTGKYVSPYAVQGSRESWISYRYHTRLPRLEKTWHLAEFDYVLKTNALGLRNPDLQAPKQDGTFRIIVLGDSFIEGFGVSESEAIPRQLEDILQQRLPGMQVECINAGAIGSDPVYQFMLLKEQLLACQPDLVILNPNKSDQIDFAIRRGFSRYQPDSSIAYRKGPGWEWLYASSFIARYLIRSTTELDDLLRPRPVINQWVEEANDTLITVLKQFGELANQQGFRLLINFFPVRQEFQEVQFDLHRVYTDLFDPEKQNALIMLDKFRRAGFSPAAADSLYYSKDTHFTPTGNRWVAAFLAEHILSMYPDFFDSP